MFISLKTQYFTNLFSFVGLSTDGPEICLVCDYITDGSVLDSIADNTYTFEQKVHIMVQGASGVTLFL